MSSRGSPGGAPPWPSHVWQGVGRVARRAREGIESCAVWPGEGWPRRACTVQHLGCALDGEHVGTWEGGVAQSAVWAEVGLHLTRSAGPQSAVRDKVQPQVAREMTILRILCKTCSQASHGR